MSRATVASLVGLVLGGCVTVADHSSGSPGQLKAFSDPVSSTVERVALTDAGARVRVADRLSPGCEFVAAVTGIAGRNELRPPGLSAEQLVAWLPRDDAVNAARNVAAPAADTVILDATATHEYRKARVSIAVYGRAFRCAPRTQ